MANKKDRHLFFHSPNKHKIIVPDFFSNINLRNNV